MIEKYTNLKINNQNPYPRIINESSHEEDVLYTKQNSFKGCITHNQIALVLCICFCIFLLLSGMGFGFVLGRSLSVLSSKNESSNQNNTEMRFVTRNQLKIQPPNNLSDEEESPMKRIRIPHTGTEGNSSTQTVSRLRMISRDEWIAVPPNNPLDEQKLPVKRVIIAHTGTENCETQAKCVFRVRIIQTFHMESKNWDDIGYNFLVGGDGAAYEGRGWDKVGAHTKGFNYGSICIAFIGTFTRVPPVQRQLDVAKLLIEEGLRLKYIDPNYKLQPHRLFYATESPGDQLYNIIKTWPHFNETID